MPNNFINSNMSHLISEHHPLAPLTTWRIGGPAARAVAPADLENVWRLMRLAYDRGWPLFFLGRGSNVLINDAGLPGLTLHLAKSLQHLTRHGGTLRAGAGVSLPRLAQAAARFGFAGFESLPGIPRTVCRRCASTSGPRGQPRRGMRRVWVVTPQLQLLQSTPPDGPGLPFLPAAQLPPLAGGGGGIYTWRTPPRPRPSRPAWRPNRPTQNPAARQPQKLRQRL